MKVHSNHTILYCYFVLADVSSNKPTTKLPVFETSVPASAEIIFRYHIHYQLSTFEKKIALSVLMLYNYIHYLLGAFELF